MDAEPSLLFLFLSLISLLILSAFFSGSETGMMAANKIKLKNLSKNLIEVRKELLSFLKNLICFWQQF